MEHSPIRLAGLSQGDPSVPKTASGAALFLFEALGRRYTFVGAGDVDLTPWQRRLLAARTFHPNGERWRERYAWKGLRALETRSRNSRRALRRIGRPFDLVVQIYGIFQTRGAPYVLYIDNTVALSCRHWPEWVAMGERDLERVLAWERRLYGEARHVFCVGSPMAASVVEDYGVPDERVTVVGGGANFHELPALDGREREPVILFVGRDWRRKAGEVLVEAFRLVRDRVPGARLQIVGTDEAPRDEPGVEVLGTIGDRGRLAELYAAARVFCLPSHYEPYGFSISEAMAFGLPCVVTDVGALSEVVVDGETGLIVPRGDARRLAEALLALLEDPQRSAAMGAAGRRRVETTLNWEATAERMAPDLERAAAEAAGAR
jgi:glycosyltransferase involved in cell wall biosynthesis